MHKPYWWHHARAARKKREEHKWKLLQTLRDAEVYRKTGKSVVNRYSRNLEIEEYTPEMYEFDQRIVDLIGQLSWFEEVVTLALKKVKAEVNNTNGKQANLYEWQFFVFLCNTYYKYTKKMPEISYSDGRVQANEVLRFLQTCYEGFGMKNLTDIAAHKKFDAINKGNNPSGFAATWLTSKATL